jgi:YjbE family integral membrane protein
VLAWGTPEFWVAAGQIVMINILLSGDNAVVIALACRNLPPRQKRLGIFWGVAGAVAARVLLTAFAVTLLQLPYVKLVGAILLVWIGVQLVATPPGGEPDVKADDRLWTAIYTIMTADVIMSLDNVVGVAAAARGNFVLLVFGLLLSIPIVVVGSSVVMRLLTSFPVLVVAGGGLLGYIAGEMMVGDPVAQTVLETQPAIEMLAPYAGFALVVAVGLVLGRRGRGGGTAA